MSRKGCTHLMKKRFAALSILTFSLSLLFAFAAMASNGAGDPKPFEVRATHGMVSSAHELASQAGVEILRKGGNAIDAAVATALALNVVESNASGIGGGGFTTIRFAKTGEVVCLDYRETAPASATKDMYASERSKKEKWSQDGGKAVGVPGWLAGMWYMLTTYGTLSFADAAAPAIRLAEEGFEIHPMQNQIVVDDFERLTKYNDPDSLPCLENGLPMAAGRILKNPALGKTFRLVAAGGPKAFYEGEMAQAIVDAVNAHGGAMTPADLMNYKMELRKPMSGTYRGYRLYSPPPASSGGTHIVQLLNILENFDIRAMGHNSPKAMHIMAEAMKMMFSDRAKYMADTAFTDVPLTGLASRAYARTQAENIRFDVIMQDVPAGNPWPFQTGDKKAYTGGLGGERISTSSFCVADGEGNIVASTNTVNYFFGSGIVVPGYGFILNNEMDDFSQDPKSVNAPEPGKRPLSSMSPTVVLDPEGRPFMAIGAAGATRILTTIAQIVMNVVDHGMEMDEAIEQPRIHNQTAGGKAGKLMVESRMPESLILYLKLRGFDVQEGVHIGTAQGILFDQKKGVMDGGADSRRLGVPVGY